MSRAPASSHARAERVVARAARLAGVTSRPGGCSRLAFSDTLREATDLYRTWLEPIGMRCEIDAAGNLSALLPGADSEAPRLLLGSHLDTVADGGPWDGALGLLVAAECAERLARAPDPPPCDVEIVAFADEEGVRFGAACFGSRALVGEVNRREIWRVDADGVMLAEALAAYTGGHKPLESVRRIPGSLGAFLEVHIEQGPILESLDRPIGIVSAIAGNTRAELSFLGASGHAGTVPMSERHDALAAAAAWAVEVERVAAAEPALVGTVGELSPHHGQVNVIAGRARATLDVRGPDDAQRHRVVDRLRHEAERQARLRGGRLQWSETLDRPATAMDPRLLDSARRVLAKQGAAPPIMVSGAGHDAAVMATLCPTALLFVRCQDGLSHHPDEHVGLEDVRAALEATDAVLDDWLARWPPSSSSATA